MLFRNSFLSEVSAFYSHFSFTLVWDLGLARGQRWTAVIRFVDPIDGQYPSPNGKLEKLLIPEGLKLESLKLELS